MIDSLLKLVPISFNKCLDESFLELLRIGRLDQAEDFDEFEARWQGVRRQDENCVG